MSSFNAAFHLLSPTQTSLPSRRVHLLGMPLDALTERAALSWISDRIARGRGTWVITPNLDILRQYHHNPEVRPFFHGANGHPGADLLLPDGMPLIWASHLMGQPLPERVPGSQLVLSLAERAAANRWSIFLLGGNPGAAERAAAVLRERFPALQIAGTCCPPAGFEKNPPQLAAIRDQLVAANPTIVYTALGFPKQEVVTRLLRPALPKATFVGVGISLSFIAGKVRRAPRWVQRAGLEWIHRLAQEPRRLARRYLLQDAPFALLHLLPFAIARRCRGNDERQAPPDAPQPSAAPAAALRASDRRNPPQVPEGLGSDERRHPRRRPGHSPQPADQSHQQASPPRLRQAHGGLSH